MDFKQSKISIDPKRRGFHLITNKISSLPIISEFLIGTAHIYIMHTSASLSINEAADPTVRSDFESFFNKIVPENELYYRHTAEGPDDMPAHLKSSLLGSSLTIPITDGSLNLGTWQGIYLCEHRASAGPRSIVITVQGTKR